jgi:LppP/LprE lipoprotein
VSGEIDPEWAEPAYEPSDDVDHSPLPPDGLGRRNVLLTAVVAGLVCIASVTLIAFTSMDRTFTPAGPRANPPPASTPASTPATSTRPVAGPATAAPPAGSCGPDETAAVRGAIAQLDPDKKTGRQWSSAPEDSNYDPCADLSAVVVTVRDGTASAPDQALMFHRGEFVGTATPKAYPFTKLENPASTGDTVVLTYRTDQSCNSCDDGTLTIVGYAWQGDHVLMLDTPPQVFDSPP